MYLYLIEVRGHKANTHKVSTVADNRATAIYQAEQCVRDTFSLPHNTTVVGTYLSHKEDLVGLPFTAMATKVLGLKPPATKGIVTLNGQAI